MNYSKKQQQQKTKKNIDDDDDDDDDEDDGGGGGVGGGVGGGGGVDGGGGGGVGGGGDSLEGQALQWGKKAKKPGKIGSLSSPIFYFAHADFFPPFPPNAVPQLSVSSCFSPLNLYFALSP